MDHASEVLRDGFVSANKRDEAIGQEAYGFLDRIPGARPFSEARVSRWRVIRLAAVPSLPS